MILACIGAFLLCTSCSIPVVWKAELPSPDGQWIASAQTFQNGGFGSAYIYTAVYVKQARVREDATQVLGFSCDGPIPHPYTLDNKANVGGSIDLTMKWLSASHLDVTYNGHAQITFQAVRFANIQITLEDLSPVPHKPSP